MIPGVGQREEFPLKSPQQQIMGPTLLNPAVIWGLLQAMALGVPV